MEFRDAKKMPHHQENSQNNRSQYVLAWRVGSCTPKGAENRGRTKTSGIGKKRRPRFLSTSGEVVEWTIPFCAHFACTYCAQRPWSQNKTAKCCVYLADVWRKHQKRPFLAIFVANTENWWSGPYSSMSCRAARPSTTTYRITQKSKIVACTCANLLNRKHLTNFCEPEGS